MTEILIDIWQKILTSNLFNFVLMLLLLNWCFKKFNIAELLESGRKNIENRINDAKISKETAIKNLSEIQKRTAIIEKESIEMIEQAGSNARVVGEKLVEDAKVQSKSFSDNTKKAIDTNIQKLRMSVTEETAQTAINMAKSYIEGELEKDRSLHIKYINESIDALKGVNIS